MNAVGRDASILSIQEIVAQCRGRTGYTVTELARRARISPTALRRTIAGTRPRWETVRRLALELGEPSETIKAAIEATEVGRVRR